MKNLRDTIAFVVMLALVIVNFEPTTQEWLRGLSDAQLGLLWMGFIASSGLVVLLQIFIWIERSHRRHWWKKIIDSRSINGWVFLVMRFCIEPMGRDIKGKDFFSIDWEEIKEKHKLTPTKKFTEEGNRLLLKGFAEADIKFSQDAIDTINLLFFSEVDGVVKDIDKQVEYMQEAWILDPFCEQGDRLLYGLQHEFSKLWGKKAFTMPLADLHMFGYKIIKHVDELLRKLKINTALRGELEVEDEPVYEEEYDDYDDGGYYVAPVVTEVHHHHESAERPIEHKPFPERKPAAQPKPRPEPVRQKVFKVQRMDRGGGWSTKYSSNNLRIAENQMRNFQNGAYRLQDENQPNVHWRIVDEDERVVF